MYGGKYRNKKVVYPLENTGSLLRFSSDECLPTMQLILTIVSSMLF